MVETILNTRKVPLSLVINLFKVADRHGVALDIDDDLCEEMTYADYRDLVNKLLRGNSMLPLALEYGSSIRIENFPLLNDFVKSSIRVQDAMESLRWFDAFFYPDVKLVVVENDTEAALRVIHLDGQNNELTGFGTEAVFGTVHTSAKQLNIPFPLKCVRLRHQIHGNIGYYQDFFGCRVEAGAMADEMVLDKDYLNAEMPGGNSVLFNLAKKNIENQIPRIVCENNEFVIALRAVVRDLVLTSGSLDLETIADNVGIGKRSLQRKLESDGRSLSNEIMQVKAEIAESMLNDSEKSLDYISALLGYTKSSSFSRAFKQIRGYSPAQYRKMMYH